jgi:Ca2+-binding EF-hand superfamily protein
MTAPISDAYRNSAAKVFRYSSDKQNHFAAFDYNTDGKLTMKELAQGFEVLGSSPLTSMYKAAFAKVFFGSDLAKVTSKGDGLYDMQGNVNTDKVHRVFARCAEKGVLTKDDVKEVVSEYGFFDRLTKNGQYDSAFKIQDSYTEDQFVSMLKGNLLRDKFLERLGG